MTPTMWVYAPTLPFAVGLIRKFEITALVDWINDSTIYKLRATERPVVVTCACVQISEDFLEFVRSRYGAILPLRCEHAPN